MSQNPEWQRHPPIRARAAGLHRQRMAKAERKYPAERGMGSPEVVPGYQLANAMRAWRHQHDLEHPQGYGSFIGPIQLLAEHTGIHPRRIHAFLDCEFEVVPSEQAELVLLAMGQEHLYGTEVQVVASPHWSLERWVAYMAERGCV